MKPRIHASRRGVLAGATALALGSSGALAASSRELSPKVLPAQRRWTSAPRPAPAREGLVDVGGARLAFWDTGGAGEAIVLLHPFTGSAAIWDYQQPVFAAAGYRVIAYSRRGHRGSDSGPQPDTGTAVDDLHRLVDALKVDRFHLVGTAAGGFIVPDYALSHPERLLSMTIASSQGGVTEPAYRQAIAAITPEPFQQMPASFRELGPSYRAGNPAGLARWEELEHSALSGESRIRQSPKNRLLWADIERIQTPTLLFTGAADLYMPPPLMMDYASHLPHCQTAIIGDAGHSAYWEQPQAFNALVLDFVRQNAPRRRR